MITFIVICAAMLAAALVLVARPLLRQKDARLAALALVIVLPIVAIALYWRVGYRTWETDEAASAAQVTVQREFIANLAQLEQRVREAPNDAAALINLGEALVAQDERSLAGRAGELFEAALARAPTNAKALWYGAMGAMSVGKLPLARERLEGVLATNPPPQIRTIIERQIQDVIQQINDKQALVSGRALTVQVSVSGTLSSEYEKSTPLFVLARDPEKGGPPLAAIRRTAGDLPLNVTLTDKDAMINGHGIGSVSRVQVVARISKTGAPQAQAGDLSGEASVEFAGDKPVAVKIVIDRKVEK